MIRALIATAFLVAVTVGPSQAGDCDQYRFGTLSWWQCKSDCNESG